MRKRAHSIGKADKYIALSLFTDQAVNDSLTLELVAETATELEERPHGQHAS
jgi:hypothetical protein